MSDPMGDHEAEAALVAMLTTLHNDSRRVRRVEFNPSGTQVQAPTGRPVGSVGSVGLSVVSLEWEAELDLVEWALGPTGEAAAPDLVNELRVAVRLPGRAWERPAVRLAARVWQRWRERLPVEEDPLVVLAANLLDAERPGVARRVAVPVAELDDLA